jgi:hypothetical protein
MSTLLTIILFVPLAAGAAVAAFVLLQRRRIQRDEAFQALAARRGWSLTILGEQLGRPAALRLAARSGPGWTARATRAGRGEALATQPGTEFTIDEPSWPDGLFVIGPASDPPGNLARTLGGDLAKYAEVLRALPLDHGLSLYTTADLPPRFDIAAIARRLADWDDPARPILILGPDGMRLRLRRDTTHADRMESFIDLALDLVRTI